mmetsp:Transcript_32941/g.82777  ORF Transcript_32941/g.82777 Transcript_32941/m.82777 type:complete len:234 (+) Transcript_32941:274-975(+)
MSRQTPVARGEQLAFHGDSVGGGTGGGDELGRFAPDQTVAVLGTEQLSLTIDFTEHVKAERVQRQEADDTPQRKIYRIHSQVLRLHGIQPGDASVTTVAQKVTKMLRHNIECRQIPVLTPRPVSCVEEKEEVDQHHTVGHIADGIVLLPSHQHVNHHNRVHADMTDREELDVKATNARVQLDTTKKVEYNIARGFGVVGRMDLCFDEHNKCQNGHKDQGNREHRPKVIIDGRR